MSFPGMLGLGLDWSLVDIDSPDVYWLRLTIPT